MNRKFHYWSQRSVQTSAPALDAIAANSTARHHAGSSTTLAAGGHGANDGYPPAQGNGSGKDWPDIMGTKMAAGYLTMSYRTLDRWRGEGVGPPFSKGPGLRGRIFYRRADLDDWLASRRFNSTSEYNR